MKKITEHKTFRKEIKRAQKRGKDLEKLFAIVEQLALGQAVDDKYLPHKLTGNWKPKWDCHIEPDWLLIYEVATTQVKLVVVKLVRTATHADLFN